MTPPAAIVTEEDLRAYPAEAKQLALEHLDTLNRLPPLFAALLLRELIGYDWQFPAEQAQMHGQLGLLAAPWSPALTQVMASFNALPLPPSLAGHSPARDPADYVEKTTAYLWTTGSIESFRSAGTLFGQQLAALDDAREEPQKEPLALVLVGRGASPKRLDLFTKLRPEGTLFTAVDSSECVTHALDCVRARAAKAPKPYSHWYIDGDREDEPARNQALATVTYSGSAPLRNALLERVHTARVTGAVGPEDLRTMLARLSPEELAGGGKPGVDENPDAVLRHFELRLLTAGSGTQIYSTSFVQWAAREALRRARPETLLVRYAPRQAERSLNELLAASAGPERLDPEGSLIDAEMGAYYTWLNLRRIAAPDSLRFVAVFEGGSQAIAIAPALARRSESNQPCTLAKILAWMA